MWCLYKDLVIHANVLTLPSNNAYTMLKIKIQDLLLFLIQITNNCGNKANKLDFYKKYVWFHCIMKGIRQSD